MKTIPEEKRDEFFCWEKRKKNIEKERRIKMKMKIL
jgi:hypothetical protein